MNQILKNHDRDRLFGIILGSILVTLFLYQFFKNHSIHYFPGILGVFIVLTAFIAPKILYPIRYAAQTVAYYLGIVNTYILLTVIYVILFIPVSLIFKISGRDSLNLKWDSKLNSYWVKKKKQDKYFMKHQF